jgi:uncharacterized protein
VGLENNHQERPVVSNFSLNVSREAIADVCRRNHIRRLSLFGSVLREDFRADSDVDVLVDFAPGVPIGFRIFQIEDELSSLFGGRKVDIVNRKYLNHRIRDRILAEEEVQYAEG